MIALIDGLLPQTSPVFLYVYAPFFILTIPATERTEVLYGTENVVNEELEFFSKAKTRIDTCMDYTRPSLAIGIESIKKKDETVKVFFLTALSEMHDYGAYKKEVSPKEGERYFIAKPIENEEILRRINTIVASGN